MGNSVRSKGWLFVAILAAFILMGCATAMNIPLLSVQVQALDENRQPVAGASVESDDGQRAITGLDGMATLKFSGLGAHMVSIYTENRPPVTLNVSMPMDRGKVMTAFLPRPFEGGTPPPAPISPAEEVARPRHEASMMGGGMAGMMMAQMYPMIFHSLFTANGYSMELLPYKPGEWTEWRFAADEDEDEMVLRKAFLTKLENGQEWWQVQLLGKKKEDGFVFEVLFAADRGSIRRMRQKTGEGKPAEVPVSEGWYSPPMKLTPESMEGSVVEKNVSVKVPAGDFRADILEFGSVGAEGRVRMWRAKTVPGGLVKTELTDGSGQANWRSELKAQGNGAKSILGSF